MKPKKQEKTYYNIRIPRGVYERIERAGHKPGEYIRVLVSHHSKRLETDDEQDQED